MNNSPDIIKLALKLLGVIAVLTLALAGWLVYSQPDGVGGYLTGAFAVLQLVISRVGEAIRASKYLLQSEALDLSGSEQNQ